MTASSDKEILATYDQHARDARKVAPGGHLTRADMIGIWKRVSNLHGVTVEKVRDLVENRHG